MGFQTPVGKSRSCVERLELNTKNKPFTPNPLIYSSPHYYPWLHSLAHQFDYKKRRQGWGLGQQNPISPSRLESP